jgi:MFS family permease
MSAADVSGTAGEHSGTAGPTAVAPRGDEVDTDARQRGLTRPRLSGRRIGLLCALLLIPAGALLVAVTVAHRHGALAYVGLAYLVGCGVTIGVGTSRRRSNAGQVALDRWRSAVAGVPGGAASLAASGGAAGRAASGGAAGRAAPGGAAGLAASGGGGRLLPYAAALGAAPAAVAIFAPGGTNMAWSSYRGGWQQIEIETSTWRWPRVILLLVALIFGPILYILVVIWLGTHGMAALAEERLRPC